MGMEGVGRDGEEEGPMMRSEQLQTRILEELDMTREIEDEELTRLIYRVLQEASEEEYLPLAELDKKRQSVALNYLFLWQKVDA